jgi:hypothetical protein
VGVDLTRDGGGPGTSMQLGAPQNQAAVAGSSSSLAAAREQGRASSGERWTHWINEGEQEQA